MKIVVNGLLTNYATSGTGNKAVVLLHGWADTMATFTTLRADLQKRYRVVSLDLPGFGGTDAPKGVWGLDDYGQFIAAFLKKIDQPNPYAAIGHSNGGAIAIRGLASGTLQAKKLVLLGSAGVRDVQTARKRVLKVVAKTGKVLSKPLPRSVRTKMRQKLYKASGSDMLVAEHLQETFKKVVDQDIQTDAASLQMPTLLLYGENDTETPPAYGNLLSSRIEGSDLKVITKAGHFVHHDQPDIVARAIGNFLE